MLVTRVGTNKVLEHCFGFSVSGPSCLYSGSPIPSRELDCVAWAKAQASLFLKRRALRKAGLTDQRSPPALFSGRITGRCYSDPPWHSRPFRLNHHGVGGFLQQVSCTLERGGPREAGFTEQRLPPAPCSGRITCLLFFSGCALLQVES